MPHLRPSDHGMPSGLVRRAMRLVLLLVSTQVLAQPIAFRRYDHHDGLPQSQIFAMLEDREGFLWVSTAEGMARLGPNGFTAFDQARGFHAYGATAMAQDRHGAIWACSPTYGVSRVHGSRVEHYGLGTAEAPIDVYGVAEGPGGLMHAATSSGLQVFREGRFEPLPHPALAPVKPLLSLCPGPDRSVWMGGIGLVAHWDGRSLQILPLPAESGKESVISLAHHPRIGTWAMTYRRVFHLQPAGTWKEVPLGRGLYAPQLRALAVAPTGDLLVAMRTDGLLRRSPDGQVEHLTSAQGLPLTGVTQVLQDRQGTLWVGTDGDGLLARSTYNLRAIQMDPATGVDLGLGQVTALRELSPGRTLIGSSQGLFLWESGKGVTRRWHQSNGLPSFDVWSIIPDGLGAYLVGTLKGIVRWKDGEVSRVARELDPEYPAFLFHVADGLWASTERALVELEPGGRVRRRIPIPDQLIFGSITDIAPLHDGLLLASRAGLFHFRDATGDIVPMHPAPPPSVRTTVTFATDPDGRILVGTQRGVLSFRPGGTWEPFHPDLLGETSSSWIHALGQGRYAFGTSEGILLLQQGHLTRITRNLGLISNETGYHAVMEDHRHQLWFGMTGGVCILDPQTLPTELRPPAPLLLEARWGDTSLLHPRAVDLPSGFGTLSLRFDVPWPGSPSTPQFQVWLEGIDQAWQLLPTGANALQVASLWPGTYRLRIRASLDGRTWTESAPCPIRVRKAWHQLWTLRFLALAAVAAAALLALRRRTRALERRTADLEAKVEDRTRELSLRNRSLERLHRQLKRNLEGRIQMVNTVSHDLRSPLTSILLTAGRLREDVTDPDQTSATLDVLEREAHRLETLVKNLLDRSRSEGLADSLNPRLCHPTEILLGLTDTLRFKAEAQGLESQLDLDPASEEAWVLADITALQQVLFNLLENALKFTEAPGTVGIRTRILETSFHFEVWDTGRGIPPEKLADIFEPFTQAASHDARTGWGLGLSICRTLVEAHQGTIQAESTPGQGATFRVLIPLVLPEERA